MEDPRAELTYEAAAESPKTISTPAKDHAPSTWGEWVRSCVWLPFLVSLVLYIIYAQIMPSRMDPNPSFLNAYNPEHRDDITFPQNPSTIHYGWMIVVFFLLWMVVAILSEVVLPWKSTVRKSVLGFHLLTLTLALVEALCLTNATTDFIKFRVGALRPDFFIRCFGPVLYGTTRSPSSRRWI